MLDEAALRRVLRDHDAILRVHVVGREADYWNAGAHEATSPSCFLSKPTPVETHALPSRDSLSTLADWSTANPDGVSCNFGIGNLDHHRAAMFMKRWFAEIRASWTDQATWPRLHRAACAIRRYVFEESGPFEPAAR